MYRSVFVIYKTDSQRVDEYQDSPVEKDAKLNLNTSYHDPRSFLYLGLFRELRHTYISTLVELLVLCFHIFFFVCLNK